MKTFFHSVFAARIQGKLVAALPALILAGAGLLLAAPPALADGMDGPSRYGPPPELPPGPPGDDAPRRDIHMGTVDHMRMGRDDEGNEVMEVRPRPKAQQNQPQVGPFYIYPQVGVPMGGQYGSGQTGQYAPTGPGRSSGRGGQANVGPGGPNGQGAMPAGRPDQTPPAPPGQSPMGGRTQPPSDQGQPWPGPSAGDGPGSQAFGQPGQAPPAAGSPPAGVPPTPPSGWGPTGTNQTGAGS